LGAKNNIELHNGEAYRRDEAWHPEKVVIVAGPSFGSAMSFVLLGAIIGAAGALFWNNSRSQGAASSTRSGDAAYAMNSGEVTEAGATHLLHRLSKLSSRVKSLAGRVKETAQHAGEVIGPVISEAVSEGKSAARSTREDIELDLARADAEAKAAKDPTASTSVAKDQA
jgi:gas vesicle protein